MAILRTARAQPALEGGETAAGPPDWDMPRLSRLPVFHHYSSVAAGHGRRRRPAKGRFSAQLRDHGMVRLRVTKT
ncbi:MAG: hypothetical protein ACAI44_20505 [Candidatus Sericytochromatia bacterium]